MSSLHERVRRAMLSSVPADGAAIGNTALRRAIEGLLQAEGLAFGDDDYWQAHAALIAEGMLVKGQGRGGSVRRAPVGAVAEPPVEAPADLADAADGFALQMQPRPEPAPAKAPPSKRPPAARPVEPQARAAAGEAAQIISYRHADKRKNNPEVGMVTPATDPEAGKTRWAYDPHLDPALQFDPQRAAIEQLIDDALASGEAERMREALEELRRLQSPYLAWAGKAERTSFEVDTVSLHVHERIDPASILSAVRKAMKGEGKAKGAAKAIQPGLFDAPFENLPLRDAIDFYRHERGWANRLVAGDSLLVMNSLLHKESLAGGVQMIYIDPPYGIKYGSNFQPFVGKRDVKDRNDADLTQEPEMIKAFRDTWELGIHSYLTYLRDRLLLARELLHESGSVFVQISDENVHLVRNLLDEIFGVTNFCSEIIFRKTTGKGSQSLDTTNDFILWYAKNAEVVKYRPTYEPRSIADEENLRLLQMPDGRRRRLIASEIDGRSEIAPDCRVFRPNPLTNQRPSQGNDLRTFEYQGAVFSPGQGTFRSDYVGLSRLAAANRLLPA